MAQLSSRVSRRPSELRSTAGQAEEGIGDPTVVSASASYLAADVVEVVRRDTSEGRAPR
jgi:hypothetical protein